jgi:hypothetical protein
MRRIFSQAQAESIQEALILPTCEICGGPATRYLPVVRVWGGDTDLSGHRKLSSQTPIYTVSPASFSGYKLCETHERVIAREKEQKLAEVRARVAGLNATIENEIAELEGRTLADYRRSQTAPKVES